MRHQAKYVFVDAQHLKKNFCDVTGRWSGNSVDIDVESIAGLFSANKLFYYDSIDDAARPNESAAELEARVRQQELELREINAIRNTHVRYGSMTGGGRKRRQKEVDILIAVDMMNHAIRGNMDQAILVSGDRDFAPLVETLVQMGLTVHVAGDFRYTSDILQQAADHYRPLALHEYCQLTGETDRRRMPPFPYFLSGIHEPEITGDPLASGPIGRENGHVHFVKSRNCWAVEIANRRGSRYALVANRGDFERVRLYLELQHGEAAWLDGAIALITN